MIAKTIFLSLLTLAAAVPTPQWNTSLMCTDAISNSQCFRIPHEIKRDADASSSYSIPEILDYVKTLCEKTGGEELTFPGMSFQNAESGKTVKIGEIHGTEEQILGAVKQDLDAGM